ncbi:Uncharacterised protein [Vibrio cholerae]|nr:Uncharacterised protein [Vibrio cholerae]
MIVNPTGLMGCKNDSIIELIKAHCALANRSDDIRRIN